MKYIFFLHEIYHVLERSLFPFSFFDSLRFSTFLKFNKKKRREKER